MAALLKVEPNAFEICAGHSALRVAFPACCSHILALQEALCYVLLADLQMPELLDSRHVKSLFLPHLWKTAVRAIWQYVSGVKMKDFSLASEVLVPRVMQHMLHAVMQRSRKGSQDEPCQNNPKLHVDFTIITDALKHNSARFYKSSGLSQQKGLWGIEYEKKQAHRQIREARAEGNGDGKRKGNKAKVDKHRECGGGDEGEVD